jgi:hypothetical protein
MAVSAFAPWCVLHVYCDVICCQVEDMKLEIEVTTSAKEQSDSNLKQREAQLEEAYNKVHSNTYV